MPASSRPWYRLHAVTWIVGGVVAAASVTLSVLPSGGTTSVNHEYFGFDHGWPLIFASRSTFMDSREDRSSPWIWGGHVLEFKLSALVFDITVGVVAAFGSSLTIQRLRPKITLKSVLAAVACVCCVAAWEADKWNLIWLFVACLFVSYTALGVAWFAALGLAGAVWKKFADGQ